MTKPAEAKLYGRAFQDPASLAAKPTTGWLRKMMSGPRTPEQRIYGHAFHERKK